jgi:glutaredoxin 3
MKDDIVVWSKDGCGFCEAAKQLLNDRELAFEERNIDRGEFTVEEFKQATNGQSYPQVVVGTCVVGGFHELLIALAHNDRAVWTK